MTNDLIFLKRLISAYINPSGAAEGPSVEECLDFYAGVVAEAERREVSMATATSPTKAADETAGKLKAAIKAQMERWSEVTVV